MLLFGSCARADFTARSDLDLLVLLRSSRQPLMDRVARLLDDCSGYPTDVFPLTEDELEERLRSGDPFWTRAAREAVDLFPGTGPGYTNARR